MGIFDALGDAYRAIAGVRPNSISKSIVVGDLSSSVNYDLQKSAAAQESKAYISDPMGLVEATGYKDKPFSLSYEVLRRMATRNAVIASIINTRVNQVSSFTRPARFDKSGIGFEIRLRDPNEVPTERDKELVVSIEKFLEQTGYNRDHSRDSFDTFIRKIVRDRLIYDQVTFEIVPDRKGRPAEFYAVDASTIRVASERLEESLGQKIKDKDKIKYVQVVNGSVVAYFTADELAFGVANPRTDINVSPYGFSELEMLIHQVTSHLWAEEYNSRFFSQGGTTKGILNLKGVDMGSPASREQMEAFKRQWNSQLSGVLGAWKTPVLAVDGLEYINVSQSNREMEFEKWMNYLINIACAVYQIDPAEINFPNRGGSGGTGGGGLGDGGIEERLSHSRDKGLRPLLRFVESMINQHIVSKFDDRFVFSFTGIDTKSDKEIIELQSRQVKVSRTVNEIRAEEGLEPIKGGDIILDPVFIQNLQRENMMEMQMKGEDATEYEDEDYAQESEDVEVGGEDEDEDEVGDVSKSLGREIKFLTIELDDD